MSYTIDQLQDKLRQQRGRYLVPPPRAHTGQIPSLPREFLDMAGPRPEDWDKPEYGSTAYWLAHRLGWISDEEVQADKLAQHRRKERALQTSHRFRWSRPPYPAPRETNEYVPEMSMKIVKDRNLTGSARRIVQFLMRHAYQDNRAGRSIALTVTFIMEGLQLSRRTVQRSLTLLESQGYIHCLVARGDRSRMCVGLLIELLRPLFPKHHQEKWPVRAVNAGASKSPYKQRIQVSIQKAQNKTPRHLWSVRCMDGIFRSFMKTNPLLTAHNLVT